MNNNLFFYLSNNKDYSMMLRIFEMVSAKLKQLHESGYYVLNLDSKKIVFDDDEFDKKDFISFLDVMPFNNEQNVKASNNKSLAKMMLGAYMTLETGFMDFSNANWSNDNVVNFCGNITSDSFRPDYFVDELCDNSDTYYCDYMNGIRVAQDFNSNVVSFKKTLRTSASDLYGGDEPVNDSSIEVADNIVQLSVHNNESEKRVAFINVVFYPILIGCSLIVVYVIYTCLSFMLG